MDELTEESGDSMDEMDNKEMIKVCVEEFSRLQGWMEMAEKNSELYRFKSHSDSDGRECIGSGHHKRIGYMRKAGTGIRNLPFVVSGYVCEIQNLQNLKF